MIGQVTARWQCWAWRRTTHEIPESCVRLRDQNLFESHEIYLNSKRWWVNIMMIFINKIEFLFWEDVLIGQFILNIIFSFEWNELVQWFQLLLPSQCRKKIENANLQRTKGLVCDVINSTARNHDDQQLLRTQASSFLSAIATEISLATEKMPNISK